MASLSGESDDDNDPALNEDLEDLRRACIPTATNRTDVDSSSVAAATSGADAHSDSDSIDDLEYLENIQKRFPCLSRDVPAPISLKPLGLLLPTVSDDEEDDFEILRAVEKRFSVYNEGECLMALSQSCLISFEQTYTNRLVCSFMYRGFVGLN